MSKKMKLALHKEILFAIVFAGLILGHSACSKRTTPQAENRATMSEKEEMEYIYAYTEAIRAKTGGDLSSAVKLLQECLKVNPYGTGALYELSGIYYFTGKLQEATYYGRKAWKLEPDNQWFGLHLANLYHTQNKKDSAILIYKKLVIDFPERLDFRYNLATLYNETGNEKEALKIFNEIEEQAGLSEAVGMAKEQIYYQQGKTDLAVKEIRKLIEAYPEEIRYYGILAELYSETEQDEKAAEVYQRLFEKDPDNGIAQLSISEFYRKKGEYNKAFKALEEAYKNPELEMESKIQSCISFITNEDEMSKYQENIKILLDILSQYYGADVRVKTLVADFLLRTAAFDDAANIIKEILRTEKKNYALWEQLIYILNNQGKYGELEQYASEAITYFSDRPALYFYLAIAQSENNRKEEALLTLERCLKNENIERDEMIQLMILKGELFQDLERYGESDDVFDYVLQLDPENILVLNNYAYYLSLRSKELKKAKEYSQKVIKRINNNPTYLDTYAWVLYKMKEYEEALKYIEIAIQNGGDQDSDILDHYGDILWINKKDEEAKKAWEDALILDPSNEMIKEKTEGIHRPER